MEINKEEAKAIITQAHKITFMTGAGVSTLSGIPDYRSMTGVYKDQHVPEYLLSETCFKKEQDNFYAFIQQLYHPQAKPNLIHLKIAEWTQKGHFLITQNIDGLHQKAKSKHMIEFHGNLYHLHCEKCHQTVSYASYLTCNTHLHCGGIIRPEIILYEQALPLERIKQAIKYIRQSDLIVVVGTSLKVYPFAGLIEEKREHTRVLVINNETVSCNQSWDTCTQDAKLVFERL